jgi:hypothetical protein
MTADGASRPLRRIPAIVSFLNPQPALSLVGGNRSSCPFAAVHRRQSSGLACVAFETFALSGDQAPGPFATTVKLGHPPLDWCSAQR